MWLLNDIYSMFLDIINVIPKIVYFLCVSGMALLDAAQLVMRKMAGLDVYYIGDSATPQTGDIALAFIQSIFDKNTQFPAVRNAFWALVILGIIMLVITSIISIIRQEYMPGEEESKEKPQNSKFYVVARCLKSLFLFLIVPTSVIFGLMLSDIFLRAIDSATTSGAVNGVLLSKESIKDKLVGEAIYNGDTISYTYMDLFGFDSPATATITFSGMVFRSGGYNANRVRIADKYNVSTESGMVQLSYYELLVSDQDYISNFDIFNQATTPQEAAQMLDDAFAANIKLKEPQTVIVDGVAHNFNSKLIFNFGGANAKTFSKFNVALVWYYYDLWQFNFLVAFAFLVVSLKIMVKITAGLMKRILEMVALFIISPPIVAVFPLDGGKSFGEWRKTFISKALSAYGAIIGMNIFFLILPYLNEIKFFASGMGIGFSVDGAIAMVNLIISTLFIITGLVVVESFIELISGIVGSESVAKTGGESIAKVGDTLQKSGKFVGASAGFATKVATSPFTLAAKLTGADKAIGKAANAVNRGVKKAFLRDNVKDKFDDNFQKSWNEGGAEAEYQNYAGQNATYNDSMNQAFNKRLNKNLDYNQWVKTDAGSKASEGAAKKAGLQSLADFKAHESGAGSTAFNTTRKVAFDSQYADLKKESNEEFAGTFGGKVLGSAVQPLQNLSAYASNFPLLATSAFERNDKQGLKSMMMAFKGVSAKDIELEEIHTRVKDEESQKAAVQEEMRRKEADKQKKEAESKTKDAATDAKIGQISSDVEKLKKEVKKK